VYFDACWSEIQKKNQIQNFRPKNLKHGMKIHHSRHLSWILFFLAGLEWCSRLHKSELSTVAFTLGFRLLCFFGWSRAYSLQYCWLNRGISKHKTPWPSRVITEHYEVQFLVQILKHPGGKAEIGKNSLFYT